MWKIWVICLSPGLLSSQREGGGVSRRARQRVPQINSDVETPWDPVKSTDNYNFEPVQSEYSPVESSASYDYRPVQTRGETTALTVYNDFSASASENTETVTVQYSEPSDSRTRRRRARLPRRRGHDEVNRGVVGEAQPVRKRAQISRSRSRSRSRSGSRIREEATTVSSQKELNRDERAGLETPRVSSRSRSRTRFRSRPSKATTESYETAKPYRKQESYRSSRGRPSSRKLASSKSSRYRNDEPTRAQKPKKPSRTQSSGSRILFPKKNLFGNHPKVKPSSQVKSSSQVKPSSSRVNSIDSSRTESKSSFRSRSRSEEIRPTKPLRSRDEEDEYRVQSGQRGEGSAIPKEITVTHQVPVRTVFTVVEGGETKSLFADTFKSSLEVVPVEDLQSTQIDSQRIVFAHVKTNMPAFGVTELEIEAIQPTRTYREEERSIVIRGSKTHITESIPYTVYNVETLTTTIHDTPTLEAKSLGLQGLGDQGQLGAILQSVLLNILGGNMLGRGPGPALQGPPQTQFITHTRSFITTSTSSETIVIPINYRGSKIFETVTDVVTSVITTTDTSIQTLVDHQALPFFPLAPTLHRAARVVPVSPPPINLPILHTQPPNLQTSMLTQTDTVTTTLTTMTTSKLVLTLGGREITTEIVEPHTQVVTSTVLSTQPVLVSESRPSPERTLRQLQLIQALLRLRT